MLKKMILFISVFILGSGLAFAGKVVPASGEFTISAAGFGVKAAMNVEGKAVVVWERDGIVYGQLYDKHWVKISDIVLDYKAGFWGGNPAVAIDGSGNFVIVWNEYDTDSGTDVYASKFNSNGVPVTDIFRINSYTAGNQYEPKIDMDSNGNIVVVWTSQDEDGSGFGIYAQRYDANVNPLGSEFQVNTTTAGWQVTPSIAMSPTGKFVICWASLSRPWAAPAVADVYAQLYDANGNPTGGEFIVNSYTNDDQMLPDVAMNTSGNFLIAWQSYNQDGPVNIYAQRFDAQGLPVGTEFRVSTSQVYSTPQAPDVRINRDGSV